MDVFVREQLKLCNCEHVTRLFAENGIDEAAFRKLTLSDLREILHGEFCENREIMSAIQDLRIQQENSVFTMDGELQHPKPIPNSHTATRVQKKQRAVHDDVTNILYSLQELTLHNEMERTAATETARKNYTGASAPQTGPGPSEPLRARIPHRIRILERQKKLPIFFMKQDFVEAIRNNQVLIVVGDTGSGKSTQLTQYLYENGFGSRGKIGCTQPRKVAAKALAKRVAEEVGSKLGDKVGYRIRFDNKTTNNTSIIYMTDGMLLQKFAQKPLIHSYACIMVDEAHERSMSTDVLLGLLKITIPKRPDLKLLITSATIDAEKFSKYFNNAPVFEIPGRTFPVAIQYADCCELDYVYACASTVIDIHRTEKEGDILVFLGGESEIDRCCDLISMHEEMLWVLPCHSSLPSEEQSKVFEPTPEVYKRKVVVATNIAETSITIDGIVYVVDSGVVKQSEYDPQKKLTTLDTMLVTQAQAIQRAGRAGRTLPGKCFRLYTEHTFQRMLEAPVPEIARSNLESTVLMLAAHGVEDVSRFEFMDPPPPETIEAAVTELKDLEALDGHGRLTPLGRKMSSFPLEPKLSKALMTSVYFKCTDEIIKIVSTLSAQNSGRVFLRPKGQMGKLADLSRAAFTKPEGDHHTYLNVFTQWERENYSSEWCDENYINLKALDEVLAIRKQLEYYVLELTNLNVQPSFSLSDPQAIQKCIASGCFSNIARKTARGHGMGM